MKRLCAFLTVCCIALSLGAYPYKVNVSSTLNLRSEPSADSEVLLKLKNGDIVDCSMAPEEFQGQWEWVKVSFQGTTGYLKADYLSPAESPVADKQTSARKKQWYELLDWEGDGFQWMVYLIGVLILMMWGECKFIRHLSTSMGTEYEEKPRRWDVINGALLTVTSCCILLYVALMGSNSLWFFQHSVVHSWWYVIANFIFFLYVFVDLLTFFLLTLKDVATTADKTVSLTFGFCTWLIGLLALFVCQIGDLDPTYVYWSIGICQAIQIGIVLYRFGTEHLPAALAYSLLYVVGTAAIVVLTSCLILILVALVIVAIVFAFTLKISFAPGGMLSDKEVPNNQGAIMGDEGVHINYIVNPEGKRTQLEHLSDDMYEGNDGYTYRRIGDAFHRL